MKKIYLITLLMLFISGSFIFKKESFYLEKIDDKYVLNVIIKDTNNLMTPKKCIIMRKSKTYIFNDLKFVKYKGGFKLNDVIIDYSQNDSYIILFSTKFNEMPCEIDFFTKNHILLNETNRIKDKIIFNSYIYRIDYQLVNGKNIVVNEYLNKYLIY